MPKEVVKKGGKVVAQAVLATLAVGGILVAGALAPNIFIAVRKLLELKDVSWLENKKSREKKVDDTFRYLLKRGLVKITFRGKQRYVTLTKEGQRKAKQLNINVLKILPLKTWDLRWRMVMFDIEEKRKVTREAMRGKLKELGFYQIQKSVWIHAYPCEREIQTLREFFGLSEEQYMCFEVDELPFFHEKNAREFFALKQRG